MSMHTARLRRGNSIIKSPLSSESAGRTSLGKREEFFFAAAAGSIAYMQQGFVG